MIKWKHLKICHAACWSQSKLDEAYSGNFRYNHIFEHWNVFIWAGVVKCGANILEYDHPSKDIGLKKDILEIGEAGP